jgi:hypothetical protein
MKSFRRSLCSEGRDRKSATGSRFKLLDDARVFYFYFCTGILWIKEEDKVPTFPTVLQILQNLKDRWESWHFVFLDPHFLPNLPNMLESIKNGRSCQNFEVYRLKHTWLSQGHITISVIFYLFEFL